MPFLTSAMAPCLPRTAAEYGDARTRRVIAVAVYDFDCLLLLMAVRSENPARAAHSVDLGHGILCVLDAGFTYVRLRSSQYAIGDRECCPTRRAGSHVHVNVQFV